MSNTNLALKMADLRNRKIEEIRESLINKKLQEKIQHITDYSQINRKEIDDIVNELLGKININVVLLENKESDTSLLKVIISSKDNKETEEIYEYLGEEYYDLNLEMIAKKSLDGDIELSEQYKDIPDIIQQISELEQQESLSLEEIETIKKALEESNISMDELYELNLDQELEDTSEQENKLSAKEKEELRLDTKQELNTSQRIDGTETLGKRLGLDEYSKIYIVYSNEVNKVQREDGKDNEQNNTRYSIIGIRNNDQVAEVLSGDKFKVDTKYGVNPRGNSTFTFNDDSTIQENRNIDSRYVLSDNDEVGLSFGQDENGQVRVYFEQYSRDDKTPIGMEADTPQTRSSIESRMEISTRRIISREHGIDNITNVKNEAEKEVKYDDDGKLNSEQIDGKIDIGVEFIEEYIENAKQELLQDEEINQAFTSREVEEKLSNEIYLRKISKKEDLDKIKESVKWEMCADAQIYNEHNRGK